MISFNGRIPSMGVTKVSQSQNNNKAVNSGLQADTVSFGNADPVKTGETKMINAINKILDSQVKLKPGQPLIVEADRDFIPFAELLQQEAYKKDSGYVNIKIVEPKLEALKQKYNGTDFSTGAKVNEQLESQGAAKLTFNAENNPYKLSKLTQKETSAIQATIKPDIPKNIAKKLKLDAKEMLDVNLSLQDGQPLSIVAEREHEDNVMRIVEYALKKGPRPIKVSFTEPSENSFDRNYIKYANENLFEQSAEFAKINAEYMAENKVARLILRGANPEKMADLDTEKISKSAQLASKATKPFREKIMQNQWCIYYAPTTLSAPRAYPEGKTPIESLELAAQEAPKITRVGKFGVHVDKLNKVAEKMNEFKFDEIHLYSVDPETGKPDGNTDLTLGLNKKALFEAAAMKTPDGATYYPNIPTEEVFSSPDNKRVNGWVATTRPLVLNGKVVEGLKFKFENGKVTDIKADKNLELIQKHVRENDGADMLGEVALVAGSPIYDTGRVFFDTLLDENATCHLAIGESFSECLEGADDIKDPKEKEAFLKANNMNSSTVHNDFMVGGEHVIVEGIKPDGSKVTLIQDNKFQI